MGYLQSGAVVTYPGKASFSRRPCPLRGGVSMTFSGQPTLARSLLPCAGGKSQSIPGVLPVSNRLGGGAVLYIHLYIHRIGFPFICHKHITEKPRHIAISFETAAPRSNLSSCTLDTRFLRFFVAGRRNLQHYLFFQCSHEPHIMRGIFAAWSYRPSVTMGQCSLCLLSVNHQRGRIWYWQLLIECHVRFLKS